jgi:hypothetical protein
MNNRRRILMQGYLIAARDVSYRYKMASFPINTRFTNLNEQRIKSSEEIITW